MTSLSDLYGHEENLSKAIAASNSFRELLAACGVAATEKAMFETWVDRGHEGRAGRIDIIQPTSAGIVIAEVQYGTSDGSHARRLQNYAANFRNPAFIIWIAEKFREDHANLFERAKTPVLCARISQAGEELILKKASPIYWTKRSQTKRIKESHKKYLQLIAKLFNSKASAHGREVSFMPMYKFFGQTQYERPSTARAQRFKERHKNVPRSKAWDFEANLQAIIEWYLQCLPRKTQFYLLKHPSFTQTKEQWKDEMACHWMLCNQGNDHPYIDYAYLSSIDKLPTGRNKPDVLRIDHTSRSSRGLAEGFFTSEPWYDFRNVYDFSPSCPAFHIPNPNYYQEFNEWVNEQQTRWKPGMTVEDPKIHKYWSIFEEGELNEV